MGAIPNGDIPLAVSGCLRATHNCDEWSYIGFNKKGFGFLFMSRLRLTAPTPYECN